MDKKKILIVCKAFYPENSPRSFRATELAKEFARQGHAVTVLTGEKGYDYKELLNKYPMKLKSYGKLRFKYLMKSDCKLIGDWKRKFGRLLFMLFDYPNIEIMWRLKKTLKYENDYDLLITIAVPHSVHWGTAWARNRKNTIAKTWIADCGDPYMGNTLESFKTPFYFGYLEKWFCRKADYLTIPVETAMGGYYPEFHHKIKVIPQGFHVNEIKIPKKVDKNEKIKFAYAGGVALSGVRSPIKLIEYLISIDKDFEFHIFATTSGDFLIPYMQKSKNRMFVHRALPREQIIPKLAEMDFLVNFDNGTLRNVPSKLIDYALTERPILNINPLNPEYKLIDEFLEKNYKRSFVIDDIQKYDIRNVTGKFLELL